MITVPAAKANKGLVITRERILDREDGTIINLKGITVVKK